MSLVLQAVILTMIEATCCDFFFHTFLEEKTSITAFRNKLIIVGIIACFSMISLIEFPAYLIKIFLIVLSIVIFMKIKYEVGWKQVIFLAMCYYGILLVVDSGVLALINFGGIEFQTNRLEISIKTIVLLVQCKLVLLLVVFLVNKKISKSGEYSLLKEKEQIRYMFFPVFTIFVVTVLYFDKKAQNKTVLTISLGLLLLNYLMFYQIKDINEKEQEYRKLLIEEERKKSQIEMYESIRNAYFEQRMKAHEFHKILIEIERLLENMEIEKAIEYSKGIEENIESHMNYFNTSNAMVNAIINQKYKKAKEKNIVLIMTLNHLTGIRLSDEDIIVLVANILEHGIELCDECGEVFTQIKFKLVQEEEKLVVSVNIPIAKVLEKEIQKKVKLWEQKMKQKNLKEIIKKYDGMDCCYQNESEIGYTAVFYKK